MRPAEIKPKQIIFPEDKLYKSLYKRLPILQFELGAARRSDRLGLGANGRPLLAQRLVRRQLLYMEEYKLSEHEAWKRTRSDLSGDLEAYRALLTTDIVREELAGALTADVSTLKNAHRVWVEKMTANLTGMDPLDVHFRTVQTDGLPTLRELMLKSLPPKDDSELTGKVDQIVLGDAYRNVAAPELDERDFQIPWGGQPMQRGEYERPLQQRQQPVQTQ